MDGRKLPIRGRLQNLEPETEKEAVEGTPVAIQQRWQIAAPDFVADVQVRYSVRVHLEPADPGLDESHCRGPQPKA